jgi:hypothetical protein
VEAEVQSIVANTNAVSSTVQNRAEPFAMKYIRKPPSDLTSPPVPLPADHLLHLIQYNAFRGLYHNKHLLNGLAVAFIPGTERRVPIESDEGFRGFFVIHPVKSSTAIPEALHPTQSQMHNRHATWINNLPFPTMRDMLIRYSDRFSHAEFVADIVGASYVGEDWFRGRLSHESPPSSNILLDSAADEVDDEVTTGRRGLIVWGEPHLPQNWEATPAFLEKWAWALGDCTELFQSTNRWRSERGAEHLSFVEEVVE